MADLTVLLTTIANIQASLKLMNASQEKMKAKLGSNQEESRAGQELLQEVILAKVNVSQKRKKRRWMSE
jgi:hypothetical protein